MQHFDFELIRSFVVLVKHQSFTRAAQVLGVTQPALTGRIKRLEAHLGFDLFVRTTRSVVLSAEGERLHQQALTLHLEFERTLRVARELGRNREKRIRIGATGHSAKHRWRYIDRFMIRYPDTLVEIEMCSPHQLAERVARGELDVAFTVNSSELVNFDIINLYSTPVGFLVPVGSPLANEAELDPQSLRDLGVALCGPNIHKSVYDRFVSFCSDNGIPTTIAPDANIDGLIDYARLTGKVTVISPEVSNEQWLPSNFAFRVLRGCVPLAEFCVIRRQGCESMIIETFWQLAKHQPGEQSLAG